MLKIDSEHWESKTCRKTWKTVGIFEHMVPILFLFSPRFCLNFRFSFSHLSIFWLNCFTCQIAKKVFSFNFFLFFYRFWETDIKTVRKINRSTIRRNNSTVASSWVSKSWNDFFIASHFNTGEISIEIVFFVPKEQFTRSEDTLTPHYCTRHIKYLNLLYHYFFPFTFHIFSLSRLLRYQDLLPERSRKLEATLEQALKEAVDDATLRKIKRISYSANGATEVTLNEIFN